ncbi:hypothetical protein D3C71_1678900 [compost metagenome]
MLPGRSTDSESEIGLPMSNVSSRASSSAWACNNSEKRTITALRIAGAWRDQTPDSNDNRALATAKFASAASQLATKASTRPSIGLMHSKVAPELADTYLPLMKARPSMLSALALASHSDRVN